MDNNEMNTIDSLTENQSKEFLKKTLSNTKDFDETTYELIDALLKRMPSYRTFEDGIFNILLTENKVNENVLERVAKIFNENGYKDFSNTIYQAVSNNNQDYLKWLKDNNLVSSNGYASRAFTSAIDCDNYQMIDFLVQNGEDINCTFSPIASRTPLTYAISRGKFKMAEHLIEKGADVNYCAKEDLAGYKLPAISGTSWYDIMRRGHFYDVTKLLIKNDFKYWDAAFIEAVSIGEEECLKWLFDNVVYNDSLDELLILASSKTRINIVDILLEKGANVNSVNDYSPLINASRVGDVDMVKHLIEKGANVNLANSEGMTPLKMAINKGQMDCLVTLLQKGAECPKKLNKVINKSIENGNDLKLAIYNFYDNGELPKSFSKDLYLNENKYFETDEEHDFDEPHTML